jgi:hypothetical protein
MSSNLWRGLGVLFGIDIKKKRLKTGKLQSYNDSPVESFPFLVSIIDHIDSTAEMIIAPVAMYMLLFACSLDSAEASNNEVLLSLSSFA